VTLVGVELPVARISLSGSCNGCSSSATTLRDVVERALVSAVPGLHQVEVVPTAPEPTLVPLGAVGLRPGAAPPAQSGPPTVGTGWTRGPALADITDGRVTLWRPEGVAQDDPAVALVRIGERISAFRDECVHDGLSLERGLVDPGGCLLTCPWHGMKYQALTGESLSMVDRRLTAYPARVDDGALWVRLGP
jgi:nitrite reductase/ring-hydroxylating ferredoxin subunit